MICDILRLGNLEISQGFKCHSIRRYCKPNSLVLLYIIIVLNCQPSFIQFHSLFCNVLLFILLCDFNWKLERKNVLFIIEPKQEAYGQTKTNPRVIMLYSPKGSVVNND